MIPPGTAAVILAAGASTRLGRPKQLIEIGGETLLARAVRVALEAGCAPVFVVVGAYLPEVIAYSGIQDQGALPVVNDDWESGMASSIVRGIRTMMIVKKTSGVILMTCDQPSVTAEHLQALAASGEVTASAYGARRGVPAYFPAASFPALLKLSGDAGARELLKDAPAIDLPGGELDIDTPADLAEARARFG